MIDREARDRAAQLVERFRAGTASDDDLDDEWPDSLDGALSQIHLHLWHATDDIRTYVLAPSDRTGALDAFLKRVAIFLRADQEYLWPRVREPSLFSITLALVTLGASRVLSAGEWCRFRQAGDVDAWPFICDADLRGARDRTGEQ